MPLHTHPWLRRLVLPLLRRLSPRTFTIRHHYTGEPVLLDPYCHKGYRFHGRRREQESMHLFARVLRRGDHVCEVGGHIGYLSLYFRSLVDPGEVTVFEPGENNLPFIRHNVQRPGIHLVEKAVGRQCGVVQFYLDALTGQNNSTVRDFDGLQRNSKAAFVPVTVREVEVECVSLDTYYEHASRSPDFVKIDVEGGEWAVLQGAERLLRREHPALMVEVQANAPEIFALLHSAGYTLFNPRGEACSEPGDLSDNIFALHVARHATLLRELGIQAAQPAASGPV